MTKTKFILIDYENVHTFSPADLSILKGEEFRVKLFLGVHNKEIGVDLVDALLPIGSRVELIRLKAAGTNALDLVIAFYIGKLWQETPEATFFIISKDSDYNALVKNLKAIGVDAHRRACIADVDNDVRNSVAERSRCKGDFGSLQEPASSVNLEEAPQRAERQKGTLRRTNAGFDRCSDQERPCRGSRQQGVV